MTRSTIRIGFPFAFLPILPPPLLTSCKNLEQTKSRIKIEIRAIDYDRGEPEKTVDDCRPSSSSLTHKLIFLKINCSNTSRSFWQESDGTEIFFTCRVGLRLDAKNEEKHFCQFFFLAVSCVGEKKNLTLVLSLSTIEWLSHAGELARVKFKHIDSLSVELTCTFIALANRYIRGFYRDIDSISIDLWIWSKEREPRDLAKDELYWKWTIGLSFEC